MVNGEEKTRVKEGRGLPRFFIDESDENLKYFLSGIF